jgi:predicted nucleic acid-binding protein
MAAPLTSRPKLAALDTNIPLDLAQDGAAAHNLVLRLIRLGFIPIVTQTVVQELGHLAMNGASPRTRDSAATALSSLRAWGIQPLTLKPVGNGICDVAADVIANRRLLPEEERNDAYVLVESGVCGAALLLTWDNHLLSASNEALNDVLKSFDLHPVQILHPKVILERNR